MNTKININNTQIYNLRKGMKQFREKVAWAPESEMKQLHGHDILKPIHSQDLSTKFNESYRESNFPDEKERWN